MSIRNRLFGPCNVATDKDNRELDLNAFVRRLLLFDTYILKSAELEELPALNGVFGASGVRALIEGGALRFACDPVSIGQAGQLALPGGETLGNLLPLCSFRMATVRHNNSEEMLSSALKNAHSGAALKDAIRLKQAILNALDRPPPGFGWDAIRAMHADLQNESLLRTVIAMAAQKVAGRAVPLGLVTARVTRLNPSDFRMESNIGELLALDESGKHRVLEKAALAVVHVNHCIDEMRTYGALSGALDDEVTIFGNKLGFVARELNPEAEERRFTRVLEIRDFPSLATADTRIDAEALLKARSSSECHAFRTWLQSADALSDTEVRALVIGLKARLDRAYQSVAGKSVRFLVTTLLGMVDPVGATGAAAGLLDTFVLDKLFSSSGPALFVNRTYPSIFRGGLR